MDKQKSTGFYKMVMSVLMLPLMLLLCGLGQAMAASVVTGVIGGLKKNTDGTYNITGWACSTGLNQSINVHVYMQLDGSRVFYSSATANRATSATVAERCDASGTNYGFSVPLTKAAMTTHAGKQIYVHGISPVGGGNLAIARSGYFIVPSSATSDVALPSIPSGMVLKVLSDTEISMTWTASTDNVGVKRYLVYRNAVHVGTVATPSYVHKGLKPATAYTFKVSAQDAAGNTSPFSALKTATTLKATAAAPAVVISNPKAGQVVPVSQDDEVVVTVNVTPTSTSGNVVRVDFFDGATAIGSDPTGNPYQIDYLPLVAGQHTIKARAVTTSGQVGVASVSFTVGKPAPTPAPTPAPAPTGDNVAPSVPLGLAGAAASSSRIDLTWKASTDNVKVTGYKVFRNGVQVGTTATPSYASTGLAAATSYAFRVSSYDAAGNNSAQSLIVNTSTLKSTQPPATGCPAGAVTLPVGGNLAALVSAAANGTSFCIPAGEYRLASVKPKNNQKFYGRPGAIWNGSRLLTSFTRSGSYWVASGQTQQGQVRASEECLPTRPRCAHPEAFFINNKALIHVDTLAKVAAGKYFFDYNADKIYFMDDPTGKKVEAAASPYAFLGGASGVHIEGLIVEKYATPIQYGAIGYNIPSTGWNIVNNEVRLNHAVGIIGGTNSKIDGNFVHDNGEMGIGCNGDDILMQNNEIAHNGYFSGLDPFWEGGGTKCAETNRLIVRNNYSHHNNGLGLWTDIDNQNTLYEGNRVEYNIHGGISHEISYSAIIRNNTFKGNGQSASGWLWGGAIQIQDSQDVEVHGNTIEMEGKGNGICLIQQNRGTGAFGPYKNRNNFVHHNTIIAKTPGMGTSGAVADFDEAGMKAGNNRFNNNAYKVDDLADDHWSWVDETYAWAQYRSVTRQDLNSTAAVTP